MPDYSVDYPFGLKNSTLPEYGLGNVFSKKLIIMSGSEDTNENDPSLANFPLAEAEGKNRFERAKSYYAAAEQEAGRLLVPLNWEYHIVPGVGHDEAGMAGSFGRNPVQYHIKNLDAYWNFLYSARNCQYFGTFQTPAGTTFFINPVCHSPF